MNNHFLTEYWADDQILAHHFYETGKLRPASHLSTQMDKPPIPPWMYLLISHYLGSLDKNSSCSRQLTPCERLCEQTPPQNHLIFTIHNLLFTDYHPNDTLACKAWERELSLSLTLEDWEQIYLNIHKGSVNVSTQENGYKIQSRWYRTPALLHKFTPTIPEICWRCHKERGTILHIWWTCPCIQTFWKEVKRITSQVTSYDFELAPAQFLLHHSPLPHKSYHKSLAMHLINAAKQCIPIHWRSANTPPLKEWFSRIKKIAEIEELIHIAWDTTITLEPNGHAGHTSRLQQNSPD